MRWLRPDNSQTGRRLADDERERQLRRPAAGDKPPPDPRHEPVRTLAGLGARRILLPAQAASDEVADTDTERRRSAHDPDRHADDNHVSRHCTPLPQLKTGNPVPHFDINYTIRFHFSQNFSGKFSMLVVRPQGRVRTPRSLMPLRAHYKPSASRIPRLSSHPAGQVPHPHTVFAPAGFSPQRFLPFSTSAAYSGASPLPARAKPANSPQSNPVAVLAFSGALSYTSSAAQETSSAGFRCTATSGEDDESGTV